MEYDVIIIGSGPAGLTAGIYTARAELKTLLVAGAKWGGQLMLTTDVENFPGFAEGVQGPELMERMRKQAERFGVKIIDEDVTRVELTKKPFFLATALVTPPVSPPDSGGEQKGEYWARSVIIATGAETKWLGLPSEQRLIGRGVSSCAPCDAPFFRNKKVIVVGGGDAAMEEVMVLTKFASEVTLVHRSETFRASKIMQDRVKANPKVRILPNTEVVEVLGEERVMGVRLKTQKLQTSKTQNNVKIINENEKELVWEMAIDGVFVAIGHSPATQLFAGQLELDEKGYIKSARHGQFTKPEDDGKMATHRYHTMTSVEGVFVAGDVHDYHYRQAITAAGYGCEAAIEAERWLAQNGH